MVFIIFNLFYFIYVGFFIRVDYVKLLEIFDILIRVLVFVEFIAFVGSYF